MADNMNLSSAVNSTVASSDYVNQLLEGDYYVGSSINTDGVNSISDTSWITDWALWHGSYMDVPIFAQTMDTLAVWTVGKGFTGKDVEKLEKIKGNGKDDANSIFENLSRVMLICGDSFAEIVKDKAGRLTNLKPLNPGNLQVIYNPSGIISRYDQVNPTTKQKLRPFKPKEIFHLSWNRLADETHGKPYAERAMPIINQIKQLQEDLGIRFHRIVKPQRLFESNTDDETTNAEVESKLATGYKKCDIIVIPKGTLAPVPGENVQNAQDAITYANDLIRAFVTACGVPEVILGWSVGTTEASAKIVYLAYQQRIERIQKFLEEQIKMQLGLEINFEFPASLEPAMTTAPGGAFGKPSVSTPGQDNKKAGKINNVMRK
jgi:hypothetical protein